MGDVMGRGVRAAAVMGQLRAAVRAYARLDLPPADVLEFLDGVVRDLGDDQIVTCVYAVFDPGDRSLELRQRRAPAAADHRPGRAAASPRPGRRPAAGHRPADAARRRVELPLGARSTLYTDGLVERRDRDHRRRHRRARRRAWRRHAGVAALRPRSSPRCCPTAPTTTSPSCWPASREADAATRRRAPRSGARPAPSSETRAFVGRRWASGRARRSRATPSCCPELVANASSARPPADPAAPAQPASTCSSRSSTRPASRASCARPPTTSTAAGSAGRDAGRPLGHATDHDGKAVWCALELTRYV